MRCSSRPAGTPWLGDVIRSFKTARRLFLFLWFDEKIVVSLFYVSLLFLVVAVISSLWGAMAIASMGAFASLVTITIAVIVYYVLNELL
jgi:hypothetical protein